MNLNKKLILVGAFLLYSLSMAGNAFASDDIAEEEDNPCAAVIDLEDGEMILPCVSLYGDVLDDNGDVVQEVIASFSVQMRQRGNSLNWEVTLVELEQKLNEDIQSAIAEETEACSSKIQLDNGVLYLPCLQLDGDGDGDGDGETFEVYMEMSQRGNSSNWEIKLINNSDGEEIYYRHDDEKGEDDDDEDDDCPSANASDTAKANHSECVYED